MIYGSINKRMDKEAVMCSCNKPVLSNKNELLIHLTTWMNFTNILGKRGIHKRIYMV